MQNNSKTTSEILANPVISYMYDPDANYTFSTYGVECDDGWYDVIIPTLIKIAGIDQEKAIRIFQIKEKFGGLRIYMEFPDDHDFYTKVSELISNAEHDSMFICELCGSDEDVTTASISEKRSYIRTLCSICRKKAQ